MLENGTDQQLKLSQPKLVQIIVYIQPLRKQNTMLLHYKDQLVTAV
jgi:hypothetical protein